MPDALVGRCWPAVFAVIGSALTDAGFPVIEGLLSLVHLDHAAHLLATMPNGKAELSVTATASAAVDTEVGRVIPVSVTIADGDGTVVAKLEERFAIRGRTGAIELSDPPRAGGAITDNATDTPRRRRRDVTVTAPTDMSAFAVVSGDHNPIHTDRAAALLAGLKSPIVHGMWLSAAAQHVVTATDGQATPPARLVGWTSRFLGMVLPGDDIEFRVDRIGIDRGAEIIEVTAKVDNELVMAATAQLAAPKTVYAFPGQGIQHKGMGMEVRARSKAARKVWDSADKFTRDTLGFSVLHVVRDNPTSLIASGVHYQHPEGVLYLTQFTQVAMATVAAAQVAEMREQGAFVEGAIACGHSVGEYTALACVSGVYELEALLEVVFHRGSKMHDIVPRDERGRSNYRLAAIRPSQIDLPDADVTSFVAEIAERTGEFLQIVNFNLRGSQYAIAGTVRGLEALEEEVERRREISGGKRSFILVPGIDVPFHSSVLRVGVDDFRRSLERVMPRDKDPELIIGRYIPNLVPRPFTLDRDFIQEIRDLVPAEPLDEILADYDTWRNEKPRELCRKLVDRAAGVAVRQPGALDRDAGSALHRGGRRRARHRTLRRDRCEVGADGGGAGDQYAEAARVFAQHHRSAQLRARRRGAVRDRHGSGTGRWTMSPPSRPPWPRRLRPRPPQRRRRQPQPRRPAVPVRMTSRSVPTTPRWRSSRCRRRCASTRSSPWTPSSRSPTVRPRDATSCWSTSVPS